MQLEVGCLLQGILEKGGAADGEINSSLQMQNANVGSQQLRKKKVDVHNLHR